MSGIILFMDLELSERISYHLTTLHKNTIQTNHRCIKIHSGVILTTLRKSKHRGWSESILELLETFLTSIRPFTLGLILIQSCQWGRNWRKTLHEPVIITSQSQEATNIYRSKRFWIVLNNFTLPRIYLYTFAGHNMTKEGHWSKQEFTLAEFGIQLVLPKYLQCQSQMLFMLFLGLRVDTNFINEYYDEGVKELSEDPIREIHKCSKCIS